MSSQDIGGSCTLHLLDSSQGHPIQTWRFKDCHHLSIGRADDSDISLADPQISRMHVELTFDDGKWVLQSHGRNGTQVGGEMVTEVRLTDRTVFQLGPNGPSLQFVTVNNSVSELMTKARNERCNRWLESSASAKSG